MNKPELGVKRDCPNCGARFYDLNRTPAHCPKCEHDFTPEALLKPRKRREDEPQEGAAAPAAPKPAAETSLQEADKEKEGAKSKRKPGLDDAAEGGGEEEIEFEDIDVEIDDDDDDTLLEDEEDEEDGVGDIVGGGGEDDA